MLEGLGNLRDGSREVKSELLGMAFCVEKFGSKMKTRIKDNK